MANQVGNFNCQYCSTEFEMQNSSFMLWCQFGFTKDKSDITDIIMVDDPEVSHFTNCLVEASEIAQFYKFCLREGD